jgi:hypothetical protein
VRSKEETQANVSLEPLPELERPDGATVDDVWARGYVLDVQGLPTAQAALWRSRMWLLTKVLWGTRDRLLELAQSAAAQSPRASGWAVFSHAEDRFLLTVDHGTATLGPVDDVDTSLTKRYGLDRHQARQVQGALLASEQPGTELSSGHLEDLVPFESALLREGELAGTSIGGFRIDRKHRIFADDLAILHEHARTHDRSLSATLGSMYLEARDGLLVGTVPRADPTTESTFLSLSPWFAYELEATANEQGRPMEWLIHRIIARGAEGPAS